MADSTGDKAKVIDFETRRAERGRSKGVSAPDTRPSLPAVRPEDKPQSLTGDFRWLLHRATSKLLAHGSLNTSHISDPDKIINTALSLKDATKAQLVLTGAVMAVLSGEIGRRHAMSRAEYSQLIENALEDVEGRLDRLQQTVTRMDQRRLSLLDTRADITEQALGIFDQYVAIQARDGGRSP